MNAAEEIPASVCAAVGSQLGAFLSGIHGIPVAEFDSSAVKHESLCLEDCLASARDDYAQARAGIPTQYAPRVQRFLDASPPSDGLEWSRGVFAQRSRQRAHPRTERRCVRDYRLGRHSGHRSSVRFRPAISRSGTDGPGSLTRGLRPGPFSRERSDTAACAFFRPMAGAGEHRIRADAAERCVSRRGDALAEVAISLSIGRMMRISVVSSRSSPDRVDAPKQVFDVV